MVNRPCGFAYLTAIVTNLWQFRIGQALVLDFRGGCHLCLPLRVKGYPVKGIQGSFFCPDAQARTRARAIALLRTASPQVGFLFDMGHRTLPPLSWPCRWYFWQAGWKSMIVPNAYAQPLTSGIKKVVALFDPNTLSCLAITWDMAWVGSYGSSGLRGGEMWEPEEGVQWARKCAGCQKSFLFKWLIIN